MALIRNRNQSIIALFRTSFVELVWFMSMSGIHSTINAISIPVMVTGLTGYIFNWVNKHIIYIISFAVSDTAQFSFM